MMMAGAYRHPPRTALIWPEALIDACSSPIAGILPPVDELARAGIGILKPGLSVVEATDVIFGLLSPEPYLVIITRRSWTAPAAPAVVTEMLTTALLR